MLNIIKYRNAYLLAKPRNVLSTYFQSQIKTREKIRQVKSHEGDKFHFAPAPHNTAELGLKSTKNRHWYQFGIPPLWSLIDISIL